MRGDPGVFGITCLTDKGLFRIPVQASLEPGVLFFPLQLEARKLKNLLIARERILTGLSGAEGEGD